MQLNNFLIESLLNQEEGPTLDFKGKQYRFEKSDTPQITAELRSQLVKDLLAFANTHRDSSAFILIGVEEVKGARGRIIGVTEHLIDDDLHDFMNKLTNRPVQFSYSPHHIEGKKVGVIEIPVQTRLIYLKNPYGKLQANAIYIRDGSSTRIATPDEIVETSTPHSPSLVVDWVDPSNYKVMGSPCTLHPLILIPQLEPDAIQRRPLPYRDPLGLTRPRYNENYPTDLIFYTYYRNAFKPLTLQIFNHGQVAGENVRFEGLVAKRKGTVVMDAQPDFPEETYDIPILINDRTYATPSTEIYLSDESDYWMIQVEFGNVRPGEKIVAEDQLWLSAVVPMRATMKGKILGENIPEPIQCSLEIKFETLQRPMTIEDVDQAKSENEHS